jgi:uncharacterized protein involved in copper resistance
MSAFRALPIAASLLALATGAAAQIPGKEEPRLGMGMQPVMDRGVFAHAILNELEGRFNGGNPEFRWEGQGWVGTDYDKLWIKSEGTLQSNGTLDDGQQQFLYARAITTFSIFRAGCAAISIHVQPVIGPPSAFRASPPTFSMSRSPGT